MENLFASSHLASGYATARPPVHPFVIEKVRRCLQLAHPLDCALDVGCGAGLSTRPLTGAARLTVGLEPAELMLRRTGATAPGARFLVGRAEQLPFRACSVDLITAAGSLNYARLDAFFPEARRVLKPDGALVVYDFSPGRRMRGAKALERWFVDFMRRYPPPPDSARRLDPEILAALAQGFRPAAHEHFEIALQLEPEFYVDYMLTETNLGFAIQSGTPESEIRAWLRETLLPLFNGAPREILFEGYFACFKL